MPPASAGKGLTRRRVPPSCPMAFVRKRLIQWQRFKLCTLLGPVLLVLPSLTYLLPLPLKWSWWPMHFALSLPKLLRDPLGCVCNMFVNVLALGLAMVCLTSSLLSSTFSPKDVPALPSCRLWPAPGWWLCLSRQEASGP